MSADLMRSAGEQFDLQKGIAVVFVKNGIARCNFARADTSPIGNVHAVLSFVFFEIPFEQRTFFYEGAVYDTQIVFVNFPPLELLVENAQGGGVFGGNDNAACVAVDAVDECGHKAVFVLRVIFPFFKQIALHAENEGVTVFVLIRMHQKPRGLVQKQEVVVLIQNGQLLAGSHKIRRRGCFVQHVVFQINRDDIPRTDAGGDLTALAV